MALLDVRSVARAFGGVRAVADASLSVEAGTITGLIGPNGAGKTTLFNIVSGLALPDRGEVCFAGREITRWTPERRSGAGLVRTFQIARGFARLTVLENLLAYGRGQPGESLLEAIASPTRVWSRERALLDRALAVAERLALDHVLDLPADSISGGQKKLLELGRVLMAQPRMILLDEPIAGVNPTLARTIAQLLVGLREEGLTFLVIEHNMDLVASVCDPVVVMAEGRDFLSGSFRDVSADRRVQDAYMGKRR